VVIVDTCVLSDIVKNDEHWLEWSVETLNNQYKTNTKLLINPIIFSEFSIACDSIELVRQRLALFRVELVELSETALFSAGRAFYKYRRNHQGTKSNVLPDFFIGAHAEDLAVPIITRDIARFRTYFPKVELISP